MSDQEMPGQKAQNGQSLLKATTVTGFSAFWGAFLSMALRNSFLDATIDVSWRSSALRVAFFLGFAACALVVSRTPQGALVGSRGRVLAGLTALFFVIACVSALLSWVLATTLPLAFDLAVWLLAGCALSGLFFLWIDGIARTGMAGFPSCLSLSLGIGSVLYLAMSMLPAGFNSTLLGLCPLASLAILHVLATDGPSASRKEIPFAESHRRAGLSWSFGVFYVAYGIAFGAGCGSVTQAVSQPSLFIGAALAPCLGALAAFLFLVGSGARRPQASMLRMLFPFLVAALLGMSLTEGFLYVLCGLLLIACYAFFLLASIAFETCSAHERAASPLYFVGTSQTALSIGIAVGFALVVAMTLGGTLNAAALSVISLALVVALSVIVGFSPLEAAAGAKAEQAGHATGKAERAPHAAQTDQTGQTAQADPSGRIERARQVAQSDQIDHKALTRQDSQAAAAEQTCQASHALPAEQAGQSEHVDRTGQPIPGSKLSNGQLANGMQHSRNADDEQYERGAEDTRAERDAAGTTERQGDSEDRGEGRWKAACHAIAEECKLSPRETEVFFLLAKGRGTEHIQNALTISSHTVKTHTYNIYRKLGVNSRDELLDAVEKAKQAQRSEPSKVR